MPTPEMQKLEDVSKAFNDFKAANDQQIADLKAKGYSKAELEEKLQKIDADIQAKMDEVKTAMNRMAAGGGRDEKAINDAAKCEIFRKAMKGGIASLSEKELKEYYGEDHPEVKALAVNSNPDGGFLVRPELSSEIVKKIFESSPMRQLSSVQTIGTDSLEILQDLGEASSGWVGETASRPATGTPQFSQIVIPAHELYANPFATQKLLDDAYVNVEAWLAEKVSSKFARDEATAFVSGSGVQKPKGILSYAAGTGFNQLEQVASGSATGFTADGLIDILGSLKAEYLANASWLFKRASMTAIRKLKDGDGRYLWSPFNTQGVVDAILGRPVYYANDFQSIGSNNLVGALGDFKAGYQIVDRFGVRVLRDPYTNKPYVGFYSTKRTGGGVKDFDAIKIVKCTT